MARPTTRLGRALKAAATRCIPRVIAKVQEAVGTPYPPASQPGEPPHARSHTYQRSWRGKSEYEGGRTSVIIKSNDPKAVYLANGTDRMAPRPLPPELIEECALIVRKEIDTVLAAMGK